jgi:hypothetical protein
VFWTVNCLLFLAHSEILKLRIKLCVCIITRLCLC